MTHSATLKLSLNIDQTRAIDLASAEAKLRKALSLVFTDGAGANMIDRSWSDRRTLAASATEDLDLSGSLLDIYGQSVVFARIKGILVLGAAANTNNVNVIRSSSNGVPLFLAAGDGIPVKPGGALLWVAPDASGIAVTASTGDLITVTNSGGTTGVDYDIVIIGSST